MIIHCQLCEHKYLYKLDAMVFFLWQLHRGLNKSIVHTYTHVDIKKMRNERWNICHNKHNSLSYYDTIDKSLPRAFSDQFIHRIEEKMLPSEHGPHYKHWIPSNLSSVSLEMNWKRNNWRRNAKQTQNQ